MQKCKHFNLPLPPGEVIKIYSHPLKRQGEGANYAILYNIKKLCREISIKRKSGF